VSVIDTATNTVTATIPIGINATCGVAVTPDSTVSTPPTGVRALCR
jgi:DNA-binding beta-propeller fold protein YncE